MGMIGSFTSIHSGLPLHGNTSCILSQFHSFIKITVGRLRANVRTPRQKLSCAATWQTREYWFGAYVNFDELLKGMLRSVLVQDSVSIHWTKCKKDNNNNKGFTANTIELNWYSHDYYSIVSDSVACTLRYKVWTSACILFLPAGYLPTYWNS